MNNTSKKLSFWVLLAIFFISLATLTFEIFLIRIDSYLFTYHYAFVVVSLALLGLGLGSCFTSVFKYQKFSSSILSLSSIIFSLSLLSYLSYIFISTTPGFGFFYIILTFLPFFFSGIILGYCFRLYACFNPRVYAVNLIGASTGSLLAVFFLNAIGNPFDGIVVLCILGLFSSILFIPDLTTPKKWVRTIRYSNILLFIVAGVFSVLIFTGNLKLNLTVLNNPHKEIYFAFHNPEGEKKEGVEIINTRWSAFGRTDLVRDNSIPYAMDIFSDGAAGSYMFKFNKDIENPPDWIEDLKYKFSGYLPFLLLNPSSKNNMLVIGSGGGREVLIGLLSGIKKIEAVEVNSDIVNLVKDYSWYNGGIYNSYPNIEVIVGEGRSFIKRSREKYDIIMLSVPLTLSGATPDRYTLTENYLFTVESIREYFNHLTDDGQIIVVAHNNIEIFKLLSTTKKALREDNIVSDIFKHLYIIGSESYPLFVLKKSKIDEFDAREIHRQLHKKGYTASSSYIPNIKSGSCLPHMESEDYSQCEMLSPAFLSFARGEVRIDELQDKLNFLDLDAKTDDSPFFYKYTKGLPGDLIKSFWIIFIFPLVLIIILVVKLKKELKKKALSFIWPFTMLGIGFILVEISLIQKLILFLGNPVFSLSILLPTLLLSAGLGSFFSGFVDVSKQKLILIFSAVICFCLVLLYRFEILPYIFDKFLGGSLFFRSLIAVLLVFPLGLFMGMPVPSIIRIMNKIKLDKFIGWMWGIDGLFNVVGASLAIILAIKFGFNFALLTGGLAYLLAPLSLLKEKL